MQKKTSPHCKECQHFFVTWRNDTPRGCKFYNFQCEKWPFMVVKETTGEICLAFEEKLNKKKPLKQTY